MKVSPGRFYLGWSSVYAVAVSVVNLIGEIVTQDNIDLLAAFCMNLVYVLPVLLIAMWPLMVVYGLRIKSRRWAIVLQFLPYVMVFVAMLPIAYFWYFWSWWAIGFHFVFALAIHLVTFRPGDLLKPSDPLETPTE